VPCPISGNTFEYDLITASKNSLEQTDLDKELNAMFCETIPGVKLFYWDHIRFSNMDNETILYYLQTEILWKLHDFIHINYDQFAKNISEEVILTWYNKYLEVISGKKQKTKANSRTGKGYDIITIII
jgi:hypothetical protein